MNRNHALASALLAVLTGSAASAQPPVKSVDVTQIRSELDSARFLDRNELLTPCERDIGFGAERDGHGFWVGRFRVLDAGEGAWSLVARSQDGLQQWTRPIERVHDAAEAPWQSAVIAADRVQLQIRPDAADAQRCPVVRLEAEFVELTPSQQRGINGDDDRWTRLRQEFQQLPDSATIATWSSAIVYLRVLTPGDIYVPCSGFFVSPHVLVTAYHCITSQVDAAAAAIHSNGQVIPPGSLKFLAGMGDLDFTLLWVPGSLPHSTLTFGDNQTGELVLWQQLSRTENWVSVRDCRIAQASGVQIEHQCDTDGGTSGAPLQLRTNGRVVGVHVSGCTAGNRTAACINVGTKTREIINWILSVEAPLRNFDPAAADEILAAIRQ